MKTKKIVRICSTRNTSLDRYRLFGWFVCRMKKWKKRKEFAFFNCGSWIPNQVTIMHSLDIFLWKKCETNVKNVDKINELSAKIRAEIFEFFEDFFFLVRRQLISLVYFVYSILSPRVLLFDYAINSDSPLNPVFALFMLNRGGMCVCVQKIYWHIPMSCWNNLYSNAHICSTVSL